MEKAEDQLLGFFNVRLAVFRLRVQPAPATKSSAASGRIVCSPEAGLTQADGPGMGRRQSSGDRFHFDGRGGASKAGASPGSMSRNHGRCVRRTAPSCAGGKTSVRSQHHRRWHRPRPHGVDAALEPLRDAGSTRAMREA